MAREPGKKSGRRAAMRGVLLILILALIAKDTSQLNDPYIMRGVAQGLCLLIGGIWLMTNISAEIIKKYWPILGYITALLISCFFSVAPLYVLLQLASLVAILFFFIAYFEAETDGRGRAICRLIDTTIVCYSIVAVLSLIVIFTHPVIAYGAMENGDAGMEYRFRGLFPKAGMLASAAGLTLGLIWFSSRRKFLKLIVMAVCGVCLAMTLSRTFWVAMVVGGLSTYWFYAKDARKWILVAIVIALPVGYGIKTLDLTPDVSNAKYLRVETITNLTGRVSLWEQGIQAFYRSPYFGYGYTAGASGLKSSAHKNGGENEEDIDANRGIGKTTLHSGYLQSLLDSGAIGTLFYIAIIAVSLINILRRQDSPHNRAAFYGLMFLTVSNATQNVIYSASVYDSVMFFGLAIFAMSANKYKSRENAHYFVLDSEKQNEPEVYSDIRYKKVSSR